MEFKSITIDDVGILSRALARYGGRICDISPGNLVFWRDWYDISYSLSEEGLVIRFGDMDGVISYYCGTNDVLVARLLDFEGGEVRLTCLNEREAEYFTGKYDCADVRCDDDWNDYLYNAEDIVTLRGKKYNGQRNHINKFRRLYPDAVFSEIGKEDVERVKEFCRGYFHEFGGEKTDSAEYEEAHIIEQLGALDIYAQHTGVIKVGGEIAGFSIGETVGDTLIVHTEKANTAYEGVYPMLVKSFAERYVTKDTKYINREEDCGVEGLRISKRSYHPVEILKKYTLIIKGKK